MKTSFKKKIRREKGCRVMVTVLIYLVALGSLVFAQGVQAQFMLPAPGGSFFVYPEDPWPQYGFSGLQSSPAWVEAAYSKWRRYDRPAPTTRASLRVCGISFTPPAPLADDWFCYDRVQWGVVKIHAPEGLEGMRVEFNNLRVFENYFYTASVFVYETDQSRNWVTVYRQFDPRWGGEPYGINSGSQIKGIGCCLTCAASILTDLYNWAGIDVEINPSNLNRLLQQNNGYARKVLVDHNAVCSIINKDLSRRSAGFRVAYRRNMGVADSLVRNYGVMTTVKNGRHFVRPYAYTVKKTGGRTTKIMDPAGRAVELEHYSNPSTTNTRTYYLRRATVKELLSSPVLNTMGVKGGAGQGQDDDVYAASPGCSYGNSAVYVAGDSSLRFRLLLGDKEVAVSESESLESDDDATAVYGASVLDYQNAAPGNYTLEISGPEGTHDITFRTYDDSGERVDRDFVVVLTQGKRSATVRFEHVTDAVLVSSLDGVKLLPDGTGLELRYIKSTVSKGGSFWIQAAYPAPAVRVDSRGASIPPFFQIRVMKAIVRRVDGVFSHLELDPDSPRLDKPVDVRPLFVRPGMAKTTDGVYIKTLGRVTSLSGNYCVLDGCLGVVLDRSLENAKEGDWIKATGVYYNGAMLADSVSVGIE